MKKIILFLLIPFFGLAQFNPIFYQNRLADLNRSIKAYYKFDNNSNESTGLSPNGTVTGATFVLGKINQSIKFINDADRMDIADSDNFSFTTGSGNDVPFSISLWVYFTGFTATNGNWIINKRTQTSGGDEWQLIYNTPSNVLGFIKFDGSNNANIQGINSPTSPFSLNTFYHVVITDDGSKTNAGMKMYINGVLQSVSNNNAGTYTGMNNGTSITRIGYPSWTITGASTLRHQGLVDELGIWKNRVLNQSDITRLYNSGTGKTYPF